MKHASSQELFAHWRDRRGARIAPERAEIDPGAIRKALGDAFLLGLDAKTDPAFRLAGTRVCALFGRELKAEIFIELWQEEDRAAVRDLLAIVAEEMIGVVAGATGRTLAPFEPPFWLGSARVERLQLRAWRQLGPAAETNRLPRFVPGSRPHGFVVYDGGAS